MEEFKKCPFCGGQAMLCRSSAMFGSHIFSVACLECGIEVGFQFDPNRKEEDENAVAAKRMVDAWNRRVENG